MGSSIWSSTLMSLGSSRPLTVQKPHLTSHLGALFWQTARSAERRAMHRAVERLNGASRVESPIGSTGAQGLTSQWNDRERTVIPSQWISCKTFHWNGRLPTYPSPSDPVGPSQVRYDWTLAPTERCRTQHHLRRYLDF